MKFKCYQLSLLSDCLTIFDANCPEYFDSSEREEFNEWLEKNDHPYWVVEYDDSILACGGIYLSELYDPELDLEKQSGMAWGMVLPEFHGKKIGTQLTHFRLKYLHDQHPTYPIVCRTSQKTVGFYEKMGFKTTNLEPNGYDLGLDKITMVIWCYPTCS